jgi:hypothetical protein
MISKQLNKDVYTGFSNYVNELNGYLQALRRLGKNRVGYGAHTFEVQGSVENSIKEYVTKIPDVESVNDIIHRRSAYFSELLQEYLFSNIIVNTADYKSLVEWDIFEYFGLLSTQLNPDGEFNNLVKNGGFSVEITSNFYTKSTIFVVLFFGKSCSCKIWG